MHVMMIDELDRAALLHMVDLPANMYRYCKAIKVYETGEIIKEPTKAEGQVVFPTTAPMARLILAHTKYGVEVFGEDALEWTVGAEADNGFSAPAATTIDKLYIRIPQPDPSSKYLVVSDYVKHK